MQPFQAIYTRQYLQITECEGWRIKWILLILQINSSALRVFKLRSQSGHRGTSASQCALRWNWALAHLSVRYSSSGVSKIAKFLSLRYSSTDNSYYNWGKSQNFTKTYFQSKFYTLLGTFRQKQQSQFFSAWAHSYKRLVSVTATFKGSQSYWACACASGEQERCFFFGYFCFGSRIIVSS